LDHDRPKLRCSVGVTAYNEEANIGRLLEALLTQHTRDVEIVEIIVVASACTDNTVPIVESYAAEYPLVKLFTQARREGKTSAINSWPTPARESACWRAATRCRTRTPSSIWCACSPTRRWV
jgi:glycosyltransferase involved in cell wall biosynthesis